MTDELRLRLALAFAERMVGIGGSTAKALQIASVQYDIEPDALLTEWLRRLLAKAAAADAIDKAAGGTA